VPGDEVQVRTGLLSAVEWVAALLWMKEALDEVRLIMDDSDAWLPMGDDASDSRRPSTDCASRCAEPPCLTDGFSRTSALALSLVDPVVLAACCWVLLLLLVVMVQFGNLLATVCAQNAAKLVGEQQRRLRNVCKIFVGPQKNAGHEPSKVCSVVADRRAGDVTGVA
jgi:hypothetical protein